MSTVLDGTARYENLKNCISGIIQHIDETGSDDLMKYLYLRYEMTGLAPDFGQYKADLNFLELLCNEFSVSENCAHCDLPIYEHPHDDCDYFVIADLPQ